ncbi:MAG TPA: site-2 protease family protein [Candidatus Saccharimonadales bacterium]|nr:site-2 protease family protein [Candidatus Saccharimonadales bacterium]
MFESLTLSNIVVAVVCVLVAMTVHEFMHAYVGFKLGDTTAMEHGRISFNPLHHIDPIMTVALPVITILLFRFPFLAAKPVPFDPRQLKYGEYGAALLAAAGPLSNLVLAFGVALLLRFIDFGVFLDNALALFVELNVALAIFNFIPIPPLDGSRVLYAFAPEPVQDVMQRIEPFGFFIVLALVFTGVFGPLLINLNNFVLNLLP